MEDQTKLRLDILQHKDREAYCCRTRMMDGDKTTEVWYSQEFTTLEEARAYANKQYERLMTAAKAFGIKATGRRGKYDDHV